jgi:3-methyladenine DNA glycosylase/8-oxoguanine DNA glycosylase
MEGMTPDPKPHAGAAVVAYGRAVHDRGFGRRWAAGRPVDIQATLWPLRRGPGDPAHRLDASAVFWRACATPDGDGTLAMRLAAPDVVDARAWGFGAGWLLERVPTLLGASDDWSSLDVSGHPVLREVARRRPGLRLPATGLVMDALVPAVLEQRVTGGEARRAWAGLLRRFGRPAPGPNPALRVPPSATDLLSVPTWDWHRLGVDGQRQRAIRAAATVAHRLEEAADLPRREALARLRTVPGVGAWTAAETLQRAIGHPDAVSVGDFHLPAIVGWFFTGQRGGTDEQMLHLLAPWAGQRQRVVRLIELAGLAPPRRGPRYAPLNTRAM